LPADAIVAEPRAGVKQSGPFHLISVVTFDRLYKGPDTLVEAVSACVKRNPNIDLTFVGDGRMRAEIKQLAQQLGLAGRVRFAGLLSSSAAVRCELDAADLFVLPSRVEGLPKAVVEAMARALPCIGSTVGGIPELLPAEDLVPPNDPATLARRIEEVLGNPKRLQRMSARNLATAQHYRSDILRARRIGFYSALRSHTAQWLKIQSTHSLAASDYA
jgi:glycosyltransferase involved in cell wall biosynthesis